MFKTIAKKTMACGLVALGGLTAMNVSNVNQKLKDYKILLNTQPEDVYELKGKDYA